MPRTCSCLNGGICYINRCECKSGFVGERCELTEISWDASKDDSSEVEKEVASMSALVIAFVLLLMIIVAGVVGFFIWRRLRSMRKEKLRSKNESQEKSNRLSENLVSQIDKRLLETPLHIDFLEINNKSYENCRQIVICLQQSDVSEIETPIIIKPINETSFSSPQEVDSPPEMMNLPRRKRSLAISR